MRSNVMSLSEAQVTTQFVERNFFAMKLLKLMLILCMPLSSTATSAPPVRSPAPHLLRLYDQMIERIDLASAIDAALRKDAEDLIRRLHSVGAPQGDSLRELLEERDAEDKKKEAAMVQTEVPVAPAVQPITIPIRVSTLTRGRPEEINLADSEPLSHETYGDILQRQKEHGDPMIIARVVTYDAAGKLFVHYYDAYFFNEWRFGKNYPLTGTLAVVHPTNPINMLPISGEIQYFIYDPSQAAQGFQYAFSESDFRMNPETRLVIDEHQNINEARKKEAHERSLGEWVPAPQPQVQEVLLPQLQPQAQPAPAQPRAAPWLTISRYIGRTPTIKGLLTSINRRTISPHTRAAKLLELGRIYYEGDCVPKNFTVARQILERIRPEDNPATWHEAQYILGETYYKQQDYVRAAQYWQAVDVAQLSETIRGRACFLLGEMYMDGRGVQQDVPKAIRYWKQAAAQELNYVSQSHAALKLGQYFLRLRDAESLAEAEHYFTIVLGNFFSGEPEWRAEAYRGLGEIYYELQNYRRAIWYFEQALNYPHAASEGAKAQVRLGEIYYLDGHGIVQDFAKAKHYFEQVVADPQADQNIRIDAERFLKEIKEKKANAEKEEEQQRISVKRPAAEEEEPAKRIKKEEPE